MISLLRQILGFLAGEAIHRDLGGESKGRPVPPPQGVVDAPQAFTPPIH